MSGVYYEEMFALWGQAFFDECFNEARAIRHKITSKNEIQEIPVDLVLAVAIKKVMEMKFRSNEDD